MDNLINNFDREVASLSSISSVLGLSDQDTMWEASVFTSEYTLIWNGSSLELSDSDDTRYPIKESNGSYRVWPAS